MSHVSSQGILQQGEPRSRKMELCRVLVVDDDAQARRELVAPLVNSGYEVLEAANAKECWKALEDYRPEILLLDIVLDKENGLELCMEIKRKETFKDVFVLFVSSSRVRPEEQSYGLEIGAEGYLTRPVEPRELVARVESMRRIKNNEQRLRSSEALWRSIFTATTDALVVIDPAGKIQLANDNASSLYGHSVEGLTGRPFSELVSDSDSKRFLKALNAARAGRRTTYEGLHLHRSGSSIEVECRFHPFNFEDEQHILATILDIRGRIQAETDRLGLVQDVLIEREHLNNVISSIPGIVWVARGDEQDPWRSIEFINSFATSLLGYSGEQWQSEGFWTSLIHPDDRERAIEKVRTVFRSKTDALVGTQFRWKHRDGHYLWVETQMSVYREDSIAIGMRGVTVDITRRKQAEDSLRYQLEFTTAITNSMAEGLIVYDGQQRITSVNDSAQQMLGWSADELEQRTLRDIVDAGSRSAVRALDRALTHEDIISNLEESFVRKDGESFPVLCSAAPIYTDHELSGAVLVFRDISELKQKEAEIHSLNSHLEARVRERTEQLERANELLTSTNSELESFSYSVSHDLRAPFRHIVGFGELLEKRAGSQLDATSRKYVRTITEAGQYAGTLVDNLLAFSKIGRTELKTSLVNTDRLMQEARNSVQMSMISREIEWDIAPDLPPVEGDVALLRLAFENLLSNAAKYTRKTTNPRIEIGVTEQDDHTVTFCVKDNGVGFDMRYSNKLFGVFQRLHRSEEFEGTGIGLATVFRIIQKHNGRVWAESEVGEGATFFVKLRRAKVFVTE